VICTPIPTHTDLALAAAKRGVHLLLEKPPAPSYAEFRRMADGVAAAGVVCQIGFQSLGSHAVPAIRELIAEGAIGTVTGVGGAGAWARDEAYYRRAPWAGKRRLNGVDVIDGALTNPLAHAVATALALNGTTRAEDVTRIETELLRANDIESDDTSCVRVTTVQGRPVTVAVDPVRRTPRRALRVGARQRGPDHLLVQAGPRPAPARGPRPRGVRVRQHGPAGEPGRPSHRRRRPVGRTGLNRRLHEGR
jgi:hypothetical protein